MMTVEEYLAQVLRFENDSFGLNIRGFSDLMSGGSELGALVCPSGEEAAQLKRAVAIMTCEEKENAETLSDEQVSELARDAEADPALLGIFFNGYNLYCKRVRGNGPRNFI